MSERTPEQERARYSDLRVSDVAKRLGVSSKTVRRYIANEELEAVDVGAGKNRVYRIERRELDRFITRRTVGGDKAAA